MPSSHCPPDRTRRSCLCRVRRCELTAGQVRSASECVQRSHCAARHRADTERTCLAVGPTQFTPPHQTRQNSRVCVVSGVAVYTAHVPTVMARWRTPHTAPSLPCPRCGARSIAMSVSVCACVCVFVCRRSYLRNYTSELHHLFCACSLQPWLGPALTA